MKKQRRGNRRSNLVNNVKALPVETINYYVQKEESYKYTVTKHLMKRMLERSNQFDLKYHENTGHFDLKDYKKMESWLKESSIRYLFNNFFIVDDEFIFAVEIEKAYNKKDIQFSFITFIGSTYENPMLHNFDKLFKKKNLYGGMDLSVSDDDAMDSVI